MKLQHTLKFATIYLPSNLDTIRLYIRSNLITKRFFIKDEKILIKQSYIILFWLKYLGHTNLLRNKDDSNIDDIEKDKYKSFKLGSYNRKEIPGFFIYPGKTYKTTIMKAPMAHKTFSQEQYQIKYYQLSITFRVDLLNNLSHTNNINESLYLIAFFKKSLPMISTNMLFLKRYTLISTSKDISFFSYFYFNSRL